MKDERKLAFCLNCDQNLDENDNFCPNCGQENMDQKVPFQVFIHDFFSNYLNFDSTFFRTIPPFLSKPGKLTQVFNAGQRRKYIHPIRLYLMLSLFYFFAISIIIPPDIVDRIMTSQLTDEKTKNAIKVNLNDSLNSSDKAELEKIVGKEELNNLNKQLTSADTSAFDSIPTRSPWLELKLAAQDQQISDSSFKASLQKSSFGLTNNFDIKAQRNFIANSNIYIINSARNLPIMMFFLLPFFALLLKLLFLKSSKYYIEHLIHSLHIHSFAYLIYGCGIFLLNYELGNLSLVGIVCFVGVTTYAYISILKIHTQGWLKLLIKFWILGFIYFNLLAIAVGTELYLSLITL
ncbi:DUF3667 domain-containing protein [Echinicola sp. CAU 1574]|uniref:DUF3667 domain-containing protein n=1 Tax=Echinicola arenosa TaxID=2774144 RepID=A0ABR9ARV6_9BACT|nr:DUF3667 domain-containing protein [Echinicola arenosa]MBD8490354.1 DUF3667 domain-containing protein [Echinicola arenosa]